MSIALSPNRILVRSLTLLSLTLLVFGCEADTCNESDYACDGGFERRAPVGPNDQGIDGEELPNYEELCEEACGEIDECAAVNPELCAVEESGTLFAECFDICDRELLSPEQIIGTSCEDGFRRLEGVSPAFATLCEGEEPAPGPPPQSVNVPCSVEGEDGVCLPTAECAGGEGVSFPGVCPGGQDNQCCVLFACDDFNGECMSTSACRSRGGDSEAGLCPGTSEVQCCTDFR